MSQPADDCERPGTTRKEGGGDAARGRGKGQLDDRLGERHTKVTRVGQLKVVQSLQRQQTDTG